MFLRKKKWARWGYCDTERTNEMFERLKRGVAALIKEAHQVLADERAEEVSFLIRFKRATFTFILHNLLIWTSPLGYFLSTITSFSKKPKVVVALVLQAILFIANRDDKLGSYLREKFGIWIALGVFLAPAISIVQGWLVNMDELKYIFFRDNSPDAELKRANKKKIRKQERKRQKVMNAMGRRSPKAEGYVYLGGVVENDSLEHVAGIEIVEEDKVKWLRVKASRLSQSLVIIGQPGAGKTTCATFVIEQLLKNNPSLRVIVVDGKGEWKWAQELATLGKKYKGQNVPVFKIGYPEHGAAFDGFQGSQEHIFSRLGILLGLNKAENSGQMHYTMQDTLLLSYICGSAYSELEIPAPRSFDDLYQRSTYDWLLQTYKKIPDAIETIEAMQKDKHLISFKRKIQTYGAMFRDIVTDKGFGFNDVPFSVFSIKTTVQGLNSQLFLDWFIEVLKYHIGNEVEGETVVIIDEFPAFNNKSIGDVLSIGRSAGVGTILLAQDAGTIEPPALRRKIMGHPHLKILLKSDYPEDMIKLAGTVDAYERGVQFEGEGEEEAHTGLGTRRVQDQFRVKPNDVRMLKEGSGFAISSGCAGKIQFGWLPEIEIDADAIDEETYNVKAINKRGLRRDEIEKLLG